MQQYSDIINNVQIAMTRYSLTDRPIPKQSDSSKVDKAEKPSLDTFIYHYLISQINIDGVL
jgi:hypothetical protein